MSERRRERGREKGNGEMERGRWREGGEDFRNVFLWKDQVK